MATFPSLAAVCLAILTVLPQASAQSLVLDLKLNAGSASLSVTGNLGSPLTVQFTTNLISGPWVSVTNHTLLANPTVFPAGPPTNSVRFYRAVVTWPSNMIWIAPGTFFMGSPTNEPLRGANEVRHSVTLTRGFFMSRYLVTQANYSSLMNTNPSDFNTNNGLAPDLNRPVERVSWFDATNYCNLLTLQERNAGRIFTNWLYRLPTEAEWEYACRSGTTTPFYYGTDLLSGMANFFGQYEYIGTNGSVLNTNGVYLARTVAVGSYQPNSKGLYDMAGNVWEWCQDWFGNYPTNSVTDPQGPGTGSYRVFRGGGFNVHPKDCRSATRSGYLPAEVQNTVGFRVVLSGP